MKNVIVVTGLYFLLVQFSGSCAKSQDFEVVTISSLERCLQGEVDIAGSDTAEVFCAKGETESFQIIVVNKSQEELPEIDLQVSSWRHEGDNPKGVPAIEIFREHYIKIEQSSGRTNRPKGMYPDALIPFVNPYTGERITDAKYVAAGQNIKAKTSQGYWVDIIVGRDVTAGVYTNEIAVLSAGQRKKLIPIRLTVWDFDLPKVHRLMTYFREIKDVSAFHHVQKESRQYRDIVLKYEEMLRSHCIDVVFHEYPSSSGATGEVRFSPIYINRLKAYTEEMKPRMFKVPSYYTSDFTKFKRYLQSYSVFLANNPWVGKPFLYIDEPSTLESYNLVYGVGKLIDQYAPQIKFLVTEQIKPRNPAYPNLEGIVDIWVPLWHKADVNDIKRRQEAGDEVWSYVALTQSDKVPNWLLDFPLVNYRIPAWFSWNLDLKGILYWTVTAWAKQGMETDPWVNSATFFAGGKIWNGEGSLVYPGADAGIAGPVASMRLKVFRDSVEDYDYFWILSQQIGLGEAQKITAKVAKDFKNYSKNPNDYLTTRQLIAEKILQNIKK